MIRVNIINASTVVTDENAAHVVAALQMQLASDFSPVWGVYAELVFTPKGGPVMDGAWQLIILDNSDQAGALGYHDLTSKGQPIGKIFAKSDLDAGLSWSVTASHELLEMLVDPGINLTALVEEPGGGKLYAYEVADAPEDDQFAYLIGGVLVSNFVYPAWFESFWKTDETKFDHRGFIHKPFELLPGGYISMYDIRSGNGWQQLTAEKQSLKSRAPVGSRRERRRTPREQWIASTR